MLGGVQQAMLVALLPLAAAQATCDPSRCTGATPACPTSTGALSAKAAVAVGEHTENVYFRNASLPRAEQ